MNKDRSNSSGHSNVESVDIATLVFGPRYSFSFKDLCPKPTQQFATRHHQARLVSRNRGGGFAKAQDLYVYEMDTTLLAAVTPRFKSAVLSALENYNQMFAKLNGRLFPFGILRIMTGRKQITTARWP